MTPNKTIDLYQRCKYFYGRKCEAKSCMECPMVVPKVGYVECKCYEIEFNTPCPHFEEADDE